MQLYKDKSGDFVELDRVEDGRAYFSQQGGGFVKSMPEAAFHVLFEAANIPDTLRPFYFSAEWFEGDLNLVGYSDGSRWNGWAVPFVTKEVAQEIVRLLDSLDEDSYRFRIEGDDIYFFDPQEQEEYKLAPDVCQTTDGEKPLYNFSLGWCWEFVDWKPQDAPEAKQRDLMEMLTDHSYRSRVLWEYINSGSGCSDGGVVDTYRREFPGTERSGESEMDWVVRCAEMDTKRLEDGKDYLLLELMGFPSKIPQRLVALMRELQQGQEPPAVGKKSSLAL